ncbi:hypothetical protein LCGC14_1732680, partial [marine sediment metagenome]
MVERVLRIGGPTQAEIRLQVMLEQRREKAVRIPFKSTPKLKAAPPKPTKKELRVVEKQVPAPPPQPIRFEIFTVDKGGGRTPQTTEAVGGIPGGKEFGQLPSGKFLTRAAA